LLREERLALVLASEVINNNDLWFLDWREWVVMDWLWVWRDSDEVGCGGYDTGDADRGDSERVHKDRRRKIGTLSIGRKAAVKSWE
jgi:hypothetical protein